MAGLGIAWRSTWEVEADLAAGRPVNLPDDFATPPNGIGAVFALAWHMTSAPVDVDRFKVDPMVELAGAG